MKVNIIYNKDFFKYVDKYVEDESVDAIITDPPYLINYGNNYWDKDEFSSFTEKWVLLALKKLKKNGTMWSFMAKDNAFTHKYCKKGFVNILQENGIVHLENWSVWARQKGRGSSKHLKSVREEVFHFTKSKKYIWNNLKMLREVVTPYVKDGRPRGWFIDNEGKRVRFTGLGNVWTYSAPQFNGISEKQIHPAQKPVMLIERLIRLSTNKNDIILDPFMGSGTTAIACKLAKRKYIGFELDKKYYSHSVDRINDFNDLLYPGFNLFTDIQIAKKTASITDKRTVQFIKNNIPKHILDKYLE